jgi:NAD(P)-dependent dehydrogenase (short-subunit alcohol dehydrogenase family)
MGWMAVICGADGATVFITRRRGEDAEKAAKGIGNGVVGITADASSPEDMVFAVEKVNKAYGRVDALVLNAGLSEPSQIAEITPAHFDRHFDATFEEWCSDSRPLFPQ